MEIIPTAQQSEAVRFAFDLNSASRTGATIRSGAFRVGPEFGIANRRNNPKRCDFFSMYESRLGNTWRAPPNSRNNRKRCLFGSVQVHTNIYSKIGGRRRPRGTHQRGSVAFRCNR